MSIMKQWAVHYALILIIRGLIELARQNKKTITYQDIALATGMFRAGAELAKALGQISAEDEDNGLTPSTSLVVRKDTGMPGDGYFTFLASRGHSVGATDADKKAFWESMRNKCWGEHTALKSA